MATPRKLEEENVNKFDFTKIELDYILQNANFNDIQLRIFNRLTDKVGRQKIVKIAIEENISDIAQSQGMMMDDREFVLDYLDRRYDRLYFNRGMTVGDVAKKYRDNVVLITMKGHIVCGKYRYNI